MHRDHALPKLQSPEPSSRDLHRLNLQPILPAIPKAPIRAARELEHTVEIDSGKVHAARKNGHDDQPSITGVSRPEVSRPVAAPSTPPAHVSHYPVSAPAHPRVATTPPLQLTVPKTPRANLPRLISPVSEAKQAFPSAGQPLPPHIQQAIEASLGVDLDGVEIHADAHAQNLAAMHSARAFAYGNHVFLGKEEKLSDLRLMAHEVAHVVQQQRVPAVLRSAPGQSDAYEQEADRAASAVVQGEKFTVTGRLSKPRVQRSVMSRLLNKLADWAYNIPGYRLLTIIIGFNPINGETVERSAANILRGMVELVPGGHQIEEALNKYGVFEKAGAWIDKQVKRMEALGSGLKSDWDHFIDNVSIWHPIRAFEDAVDLLSSAVGRIKRFLVDLATDILELIRDAILMPLAKLAEGTRGWDLLIAVLGKNPITKEPVEPTADNLIGGFMKLIGEEEVWNNIKKANAIPRAWAWFKNAVKGLLGFVSQIPSLFIEALKSLTIGDIILLPRAFKKVGMVFGNFALKFFSWAMDSVWTLLQIIFEVVAPGAIPYLKKVGEAFRSILKNPIGFVKNLVAAGKMGFQLFADHIGTHLKESFIDWLTGSLQGVYIPKSLDIREIIKFVLSVLGLTWQNIRGKLVKVVGETAVKAMETGFDIVVTLVTEGPAAAWEKIKEELGNLKDMVMQGIMDFVIETVVKKAVAKVLSLLVPGGAFIQAIISIYDTIMVFIHKLAKIIQVAKAFLDSLMEIVSGAIGGAAKKVENTLAGLLTLAISFLAGFLGLGNITDKVMDIINTKVREPIDKALDKVIDWIVTMAKKLFAKVFGKKEDGGDVRSQAAAALTSQLTTDHTREQAQSLTARVAEQFRPQGLVSLEIGEEDEEGVASIFAEASPKLPLLQLIPKGLVPRGRTVRMVAQLELSVPVSPPKMASPIAAADPSARVPMGGALLSQPTPEGAAAPLQSRIVNLVTWNTSNQSLRQTGNSGHAEHQFVNWLEGKGGNFMSTIEKVTVNVSPYSPCSPCSDELRYALKLIKDSRKNKTVDASLSWVEAYPGARGGEQMTTSQNLVELEREGWVLTGGSVPQDQSVFKNMVKVAPLK